MISRRKLARTLESVVDFEEPDPGLEQYLTPPEIAAHVLHFAALRGDLDRRVVDLGTGTGTLAVGAAVLGADVVGVDVDASALARARESRRAVGAPSIEWVRADVGSLPLVADRVTVVSNPPFGAQRRGADRPFLAAAAELAVVSYTIHNEGSRAFVESFAAERGGTVSHAFRATFELDRRFQFHEESSRSLEAEVFRIEWER